ncbi:hypothetical protein BDV26DRAFT_251790 [Aspergillus bertholletiae]|uniref:Uncharacterized protein n=1 Tax=Aspergillus bertholletiae TaxID=1226010 RepID=A0A5N7BNQ6_9EURO|nr:hypothetical protein BDV26DRAFT_251790 [Aspergillus bertholletiae]
MKLSVDAPEQWELLQAAQRFFGSLTPGANGSKNDSHHQSIEDQRLRNYEEFFQFDIRTILLHVDPDCELQPSLFHQGLDALCELLSIFNGLFEDSILSQHEDNQPSLTETAAIKTENKKGSFKRFFRRSLLHVPNEGSRTMSPSALVAESPSLSHRPSQAHPYPKLEIVRERLGEEGNIEEAIKTLERYIRQRTEKDYQVTIESISNFNRVMRQIYRPVVETRQAPVQEANSHTEKARYKCDPNYEVRDTMQALHQSLSRCLNCGLGHAVRVYLPIPQNMDSPSEVGIFMSICQDQLQWQEASCHLESTAISERGRREVHDLCETINRSHKWKRMLRLAISEELLWDHSHPREKLSNPKASPIISLRSLLERGHMFGQARKKDLPKLSLKEKRILAVVLAHSMLQLCGGPWIKQAWDAEAIFFLYDSPSQRLKLSEPYINSSLEAQESLDVNDLGDRIHKYPLILDFARLLLELQHGETIQSTKEDYDPDTQEETPDTLFFMLSRVLDELSDDIYTDYLTAIEACLDCDKFLPPEGGSFDDLAFRQRVYQNIVVPLEEELYKGFKIRTDELNSITQSFKGVPAQEYATVHIPSIAHETIRGSNCKDTVVDTTLSRRTSISSLVAATSAVTLQSFTMSQITHSSTTSYSHSSYTVAIICPMAVEMAPVLAMLDEKHEGLSFARRRNTYTLGRIGQHNVVVTVMPETGNNSAAAVATQLQNDFPDLHLALLVGIGGGIPQPGYDIRLGDVVVSKPTRAFGGVVQFDRGKVNTNGQFERTGSLNKPPAFLMTSLESLIAEHMVHGNRLDHHLAEMERKAPHMAPEYKYQGLENDILFHHSYHHTSGDTCKSCQKEMIVQRTARKSTAPRVHYGTIGSANIVVKDGTTREKLKEELGIICVEMEAAGLIEDFPCLIIRGICDYADSHKNKTWQPYAAATAAAFTKELLLFLPV